jgi:hypothetical protein
VRGKGIRKGGSGFGVAFFVEPLKKLKKLKKESYA